MEMVELHMNANQNKINCHCLIYYNITPWSRFFEGREQIDSRLKQNFRIKGDRKLKQRSVWKRL